MVRCPELDFRVPYRPWYQSAMAAGKRLLLLGLLLGVLLGCGASGARDAWRRTDVSVVTVTQADNGQSVPIRMGDRVVVHLPENPTTGFQWSLDRTNHEVLQIEDAADAVLPDGTVGRGGQRTFVLQGKKSGVAESHFKLWREWEGDKSITKHFVVTVEVRE